MKVTEQKSKKAWVSYEKINGIYFIECHVDGVWSGAGATGCSSFDAAYIFAAKVAKSKGARLERFFPEAI